MGPHPEIYVGAVVKFPFVKSTSFEFYCIFIYLSHLIKLYSSLDKQKNPKLFVKAKIDNK